MSAREIYEEIAILDVQLACDVLRPVWDEADGADGFVSLEVEPAFAHDTEATIEQAREYWERVDRPNLMVKIPGTEEGVPAIEETIAAGINVNVTLLFSVESYAAIAEAYIRGMERRHEAGESLDVHSVASFFVSRVDTEVDKRLADLGKEDLRGIAAVANARAAYMRFKELFHGERFAALREAGAPVQRPLWASTGVKDPHYPETKYVDSLVAPDTVNTMPMPTLLACAEQLEVTRRHGGPGPVGGPRRGSPRPGSTWATSRRRCSSEGIDKFVEPFDDLIGGIELAREGDRHGPAEDDQVASSPTTSSRRSSSGSRRAERENVAERVWAHDESLWGGPGVAEIGNRLGWLTISDKMLEHAADLHAFADQAKADGLEHAVLLGMGGSSLGPEVIRRSYGDVPDGCALHVLDSTDPGAVLQTERAHRPRQDALHRLVEVGRDDRDAVAHALLLRADRRRRLALLRGHRPGQPADGRGARARLPPRVRERPGHRRALLRALLLRPRARRARGREHRGHAPPGAGGRAELRQQYGDPGANSGLWLGMRHGRARPAGPRQAHLRRLGPDLELRPLGRAAGRRVHRQGGHGHPAGGRRAARRPRRLRRRPRVRVPAQRGRAGRGAGREDRGARPGRATRPPPGGSSAAPRTSGRIFFFAEFATAVAGWALGINPFDQPNVQEAKDNTAPDPEGGPAGRGPGLARGPARQGRRRRSTSRSWAT